jgi:coenzyme F420 hydrogenase subunit beta
MMDTAPPGYLRPTQKSPLSVTEEAAITAACPGLGQQVDTAGRTDDPLWGPYVTMHTGHATDPALRYAGSSGGALSMMLVHLIKEGVVDAVIQTTASPHLAIGNMTVITTDATGITVAAGSRYAPSAPLADLQGQLATGKRFAFVGKPCDVAALRAMQTRDPKLAKQIPVLLSFFCAGIPSHTGGEAVLNALDTTLDETLAFRYRGNGWPGHATATHKDGTTRSMSYHDSWGKILTQHVQHRCKICADGTGMAADIVCADAWECDADGYPVFTEKDGVSLIVGRTALGAQLIDAAHKIKRLELQDFDITTLAAIQPGQHSRRLALLARLIGRRLFGFPIPKYQGLHLAKMAKRNTLRSNFRNCAGMLRRSFKARL